MQFSSRSSFHRLMEVSKSQKMIEIDIRFLDTYLKVVCSKIAQIVKLPL